jgi:polyisoprenoid-binding protein YceI
MKRQSRIVASLALLLVAALPAFAEVETFAFDKAHTLIGFRVRHILTKVEGRFKGFEGKIWLDRANPSASRVELTIQTASIDTGVEARDNDLRSPNYFDVGKYTTISFKSSRIEPKGNDQYDVTGDFSMHGVTKTIRVPVKALGFGKMGKTEKAGFEIALPINRKDYGIVSGSPVVGDEVEINIQVEANKQMPEEWGKPAAPPVAPTPAKS